MDELGGGAWCERRSATCFQRRVISAQSLSNSMGALEGFCCETAPSCCLCEGGGARGGGGKNWIWGVGRVGGQSLMTEVDEGIGTRPFVSRIWGDRGALNEWKRSTIQ